MSRRSKGPFFWWARILVLALVLPLFAISCSQETEVSDENQRLDLTSSTSAAVYVNDIKRRLESGECMEVGPEIRSRMEKLAATSGKKSVLYADLMDLLVQSLWACGQEGQPETMELAEGALALRTQLHGERELQIIDSLYNLGVIHAERGNFATSLDYFQRVYDLRREHLGDSNPTVARTLHALGNVSSMMGNISAARVHYEKALDVYRRAYGEESADASHTMDSLASVYAKMGLMKEALDIGARALRIRESAFGPDTQPVAHSCLNYAEIRHRADPSEDVRPLIQRAIDICQGLGLSESSLLTVCYNNMGCVSYDHSDLEQAEKYFKLAIQSRERAYGADHVTAAPALMNLASLIADRGDYGASIALYQRALSTLNDRFGSRHPLTMHGMRSLAMVSLFQGEYRTAFQKGLLVEQLARDHAVQMTGSMSELESLGFQEYRTTGLDVALSALLEMMKTGGPSGLISDAWNDLIHSRGLVLDEAVERRRFLQKSDDSEVDSLLTEYRATSNRVSQSLRWAEEGETDEEVNALLADRDRLEETIAQKSRRHARMREELARRRSTGLQEVLQALPVNSNLVAYALFYQPRPVRDSKILSPGTKTSQSLDLEGFGQTVQPGVSIPGYLAFVCRPPAPPVVFYLGEATRVNELVEAWWKESSRPRPDADAIRAAGTSLRKLIWDPMAPLLSEDEATFVVLDGALNFVNLDALPGPGDSFLAETAPVFRYLPVERDVVSLSLSPRAEEEDPKLLVVGGPDYWYSQTETQDAPPSKSGGSETFLFSSLPGAKTEAEQIADLWNSRRSELESGLSPAIALTGREAGEAEFKRHIVGREVVHVATHAFFTREGEGWKSPLQRSGLALAGANVLPITGDGVEDGLLYAEEVAVLDLSRVGWVVLSACETATGDIQAREGVLGLRRAFQIAGARTLIMSLWNVEDDATRGWMVDLYSGRLSGLSTAASVREANLEAIRSGRAGDSSRSTASWGAFVFSGDWK